ncbi:MAG: glycosyltransferase, partial [Halothiobacillus sp.]|nr:glycosyltransferase [Halothiobacillus sp.]
MTQPDPSSPAHACTIEISDLSLLPGNPLISVYMLTYRHEGFIAQAIEGVVAQQLDVPFELIIGEDCSPDNTRSIVLEYQHKHPDLIRVITSDQNVGAKANAARCQAATRGTYVAICEGDDYWCDPAKLARQLAIFDAYPDCAMVFHDATVIDANTGETLRTGRRALRSRMFNTHEIILGDGGMIPTASILVRRAVLVDKPAWYRDAPVGDYPMALRGSALGKIAYLDRVMSVYRANTPHSWTRRHLPSISARLDYAKRIESMLQGFAAEHGPQFDHAIRFTVSKYYSDVLVRLQGSLEDKRAIYAAVRRKLLLSDRVISWIEVKSGMRL